jgi:hypothetical protein
MCLRRQFASVFTYESLLAVACQKSSVKLSVITHHKGSLFRCMASPSKWFSLECSGRRLSVFIGTKLGRSGRSGHLHEA